MTNRLHRRRPLFSTPTPKPPKKLPLRRRILSTAWLGLKRAAMGIGFAVLLSLFLSMCAINAAMQGAGTMPLPDPMVLTFNFSDGLEDAPHYGGLTDPFAPPKASVQEIVESINAAKTDPRVKGILARIGDGSFALAHVEEIRTALKDFKESGKFTYVYSSSYGESGGGLGRYYLASAFGEIWMQPMGVVSIPGIQAEMPFARTLLDKIGIKPDFFKRHEYKTAYESLTDSAMSEPNREEVAALISDFSKVLVSGIAQDRNLKEAQVGKLIDLGLLTADEALKENLIDKADYADVLLDKILTDVSGKTYDQFAPDEPMPLVMVEEYHAALQAHLNKSNFLGGEKPVVALVHVNGAIMQSDTPSQGTANSAEIAPAILDAAADERIKALVVRIDSPGGSPVASESILRALEKAQAKGKPVIVSMGPVAASGGYWVAAKADRIYALPTTITGSIGVLGGKLSAGKLMETLGVNWDGINWGENAGMWSFTKGFSASEAERMNAMLDSVYQAFVARVAQGRKMSPEKIHEIAKGRVWSGVRAIELGLADEQGGLNEAIGYAMKLSGIATRADMTIEELPKPKTPFEQFIEMLGGQSEVMETLRLQAGITKKIAPFTEEISILEKSGGAPLVYERLGVR